MNEAHDRTCAGLETLPFQKRTLVLDPRVWHVECVVDVGLLSQNQQETCASCLLCLAIYQHVFY